MWSSTKGLKKVPIILRDFLFEYPKGRKIEGDANDPGCHPEGSENTLSPGGLNRRFPGMSANLSSKRGSTRDNLAGET